MNPKTSTNPEELFNESKLSEISRELPLYMKISLIFLLCKDSDDGLHKIKSLRSANSHQEQDVVFKQFLIETTIILGSHFQRTFIEALRVTQNFKLARTLGFSKEEILSDLYSGHLRKAKLTLYTIAESMTENKTKEFVQHFNGNGEIRDSEKLLEELFLELSLRGDLSFNTDCAHLAFSNLLHSLPDFHSSSFPDLSIENVGETIENDVGEYYPILDSNNLGYCIIINQEEFTRNSELSHLLPENHLSTRYGSSYDVKALQDVFSWLGFRVKTHTNVSFNKLRTILSEYASAITSNHSMITLVMMSHGTEDVVYTSDSIPVSVEALEMAFQRNRCPKLVGKPKFLIIQACQGVNSQRTVTDDEGKGENSLENIILGPERGDALIAWSTVKGYASFRDRFEGSWFVQELCEELKKNATSRDLLDMMTRINSNLRKKTSQGYFMVPAVSSSLCKKIKFPVATPFTSGENPKNN